MTDIAFLLKKKDHNQLNGTLPKELAVPSLKRIGTFVNDGYSVLRA